MCSQHLQLKRVDLDCSLAKKKKKKYLPPSSNFEKPPDEKQLWFFMRPKTQFSQIAFYDIVVFM